MLLTNIRIEPVESPTVENGFIHVQRGKIAAFGPMAEMPEIKEKATDLGGQGLTAYPGFIDAHTHLGVFGDGLGFEGEDGNEDTDPLTPHLRGLDAVNPMDRGFEEALRSGVTTVVTGPGSANPIGGQMCAVKTFGRRVDDMVVKAPVAMKFAFGENPKVVYHQRSQTPVTRMATAALIREQLRKAQRYAEDIQKSEEDEDTDPPEYDIKCEALLPVLEGKLKAHIHAHRADDIVTAMRICEEFGIDYVLIHCTEGHLLADILGKAKASAACGPMIGHRSKPELAGMTLQNPGMLAAQGVRTAICTDHPEVPIEFLGISAGLAIREGMSRQAALEAVTTVPARLCDIEKKVGSIARGKDADLVLFDCDPFTVAAKPRYVVLGGKLAVGKF